MTTLDVLHFAQPLWLLGLLLVPVVLAWRYLTDSLASQGRLERYADSDLLPHLVRNVAFVARHSRWQVPLWSIVWALGIVALAGPRWDYVLQRLYRPGVDLVVLLDISRSMNVADVTPSRMERARQEIRELLDAAAGARAGLVVFASLARPVLPVSEDRDAIIRLLPQLGSDLVRFKGSRLSAALQQGDRLLAGRPAESVRALLLVSDGDFDEPGLVERVRQMTRDGLQLHVLGIGTSGGGMVPAERGTLIRDAAGNLVRSPLDEDGLRALAVAGGGVYQRASFDASDTREIVAAITDRASLQEGQRDFRVWHERFYIPLVLLLMLLLPRFRASVRAT